MSNQEQLFAEIIPSEEANLSGGTGATLPVPFLSFADAKANSLAAGGLINDARTFTDTLTAPGVAASKSHSSALTAG